MSESTVRELADLPLRKRLHSPVCGYSPAMQARVIRVDVRDGDPDSVDVLVDTVPSHPMTEYCVRMGGDYYNVASSQ